MCDAIFCITFAYAVRDILICNHIVSVVNCSLLPQIKCIFQDICFGMLSIIIIVDYSRRKLQKLRLKFRDRSTMYLSPAMMNMFE